MGIDLVNLVRFLLIGIALLLAFLAVITWNRRKDAPGAATCALLIGGMAIYAFGYSGEVAATTLDSALFWLNFEHLALPWAPGLWLLTACRHNGRKVWTPLLFVIPVITFVDQYANFHNSFYTGPMTLEQNGPFRVVVMHRGVISMVDNAYLLVAFVAGAWVYLSGLRNASSLFRKQALILLLSSQLPILGYFWYLTGFSPWGLDITPFTMAISCALFYYGFFHFGLYDLAPLARTLIFNSIRDAVLILDGQGRLLDFNPSANALLPELSKRQIGEQMETLLKGKPELLLAVSSMTDGGEAAELRFESEGALALPGLPVKTFELRTWPLISGASDVGRALIFSDVTAQVLLREELRSRAETDPLTGVANRRRFRQALELECVRFSRTFAPISLLMIDLDHFKMVNDRFGHPVGDEVLRSVAQRLLASLRKTDVLARFGGEEFAVLLPETVAEGAFVISERIRAGIEQYPVGVGGVDGPEVALSVSIGVASHAGKGTADPDVLIKQADLALYRAKAMGRNRVEAYVAPAVAVAKEPVV